MEWTQSKAGYYADFVAVPALMLATFLTQFYYNGIDRALVAIAILFYAIWTLVEYWIHRSLFHRFMRQEHWLHHKRPGGFVSAPWYLTIIIHLLALGSLLGGLGMSAGTGAFLGLEGGYLAYIIVHDRIHHGPRHSAYIRRRGALHDVHHTYGSERNFGVASSFWDHVFGTHFLPKRT